MNLFRSWIVLGCLFGVNSQKYLEADCVETGFFYSIAVTDDSPILSQQSKYQKIEVHHSDFYGKILVLDGVIQLTERDGDSYNEMMAHIPMMQHKNPKRILIVGGGDGYILSEVLKYDSVERVDHVDLDGEVIEVCKKHFSWGKAWDDPRVSLHIEDGAEFVAKAPSSIYDVVIQDSSDPWAEDDQGNRIILASSVLYEEEHIAQISRILKRTGIFNFQAETFNIPSDLEGIILWRQQALNVGFRNASYASITISTYTTGQIGLFLCEKDKFTAATMDEVSSRFADLIARGKGTTYYQPKLQQSAFDLPLWVENAIYETGMEGCVKEDL